LQTIPNSAGPVAIELAIPLGVLCEYAGEPQAGSTLTWRYVAGDVLLALDAVRAWPVQQMREPLDLETFTRRAAEQASMALGVAVEAIGHYVLRDGTVLRCQAKSS